MSDDFCGLSLKDTLKYRVGFGLSSQMVKFGTDIKQAIVQHFNTMQHESAIFTTDCNTDILWKIYTGNTKSESNPVFKTNRMHECNACKEFILKYGGLVSISNRTLQLVSIWDIITPCMYYQELFESMSQYVKTSSITGIFRNGRSILGANGAILKDIDVFFSHFQLRLHLHNILSSRKIPVFNEKVREAYDMLIRSFEEHSVDDVNEFIKNYLPVILGLQIRGFKVDEVLHKIRLFKKILAEYKKLKEPYRNYFVWSILSNYVGQFKLSDDLIYFDMAECSLMLLDYDKKTLDTTESKEKIEPAHTEYIELPGLKSPLRIQDHDKYVGEHIITECRNGVLSFLRKFMGRWEDQ